MSERPTAAPAMPRLCLITVPGLEVSDWRPVHDRLLDEFSEVTDVLPTTMKETILVIYEDPAPGDAGRWLDTVSETILSRRRSRSRPTRATSSRAVTLRKIHRRPSAGAQRAGLLR